MVTTRTKNVQTNGASPPLDHASPLPREDVHAVLDRVPAAAVRKESALLSWILHTAPLLFFVAVVISLAWYDGIEGSTQRWAPVGGFGVAVLLGMASYRLWARRTTPPCSNPRQFGKLAHWCTVLDSHLSTWCAEPVSAPSGLDPRSVERACRGVILHRNFVAASLNLIQAQPASPRIAQTTLQTDQTSTNPKGPTNGASAPQDAPRARAWHEIWGRHHGSGGTEVKRVAGQRWLTGAGYVELWERLHRAEEDMFLVLPTQEIVAAGQLDELRLSGSTIANRQGLLYRVAIALERLGGADYLTTDPQSGPAGRALLRKLTVRGPGCSSIDKCVEARYALREIRVAINEYRDAQRDGLVRVRANLSWAGTLTALVAFTLFGLAMANGTPIASIYGAVAVYLVGAVVGLFNSLSISAEDDGAETEEDYGLAQARLMNSPMLSGLAALGGVVLAYLGIGAISDASAGGNDANDFPSLAKIFDLETHPEAVAIAALFGLTPRLLIRRLQTEGNRFRQGLQRSSAPAGKHAAEFNGGD